MKESGRSWVGEAGCGRGAGSAGSVFGRKGLVCNGLVEMQGRKADWEESVCRESG